MTLTKADLIKAVQSQLEVTNNQAYKICESVFDIIKDSLESGDDVLISGFGKFSVNEKSERRGRNPKTGESMMIESRRVVTFKSSGRIKEQLQNEK